jgi:toxin-antitoxin system PIN domain toxin
LTYLLDANVLIALAVSDHEHHGIAARWAAGVDEIALCPIVEGALVRFLVRAGESRFTALGLLSGFYSSARCSFWPDSISYTDAELGRVVGHRQVTDAYLVSLAASRGGRLATFDRSLAENFPKGTALIG